MNEEGTVQRSNEVFTEEALKAQDGKTVPLTLENGGPVIGEAVLKYDSDEKALKAEFRVDDPLVRGFLRGSMPDIIGKQSPPNEAWCDGCNPDNCCGCPPSIIKKEST